MIRIHGRREFFSSKIDECFILTMDKIQFESRAEIGTIIKALEDWQEDHGKDETVQELINKLDAMSMNW